MALFTGLAALDRVVEEGEGRLSGHRGRGIKGTRWKQGRNRECRVGAYLAVRRNVLSLLPVRRVRTTGHRHKFTGVKRNWLAV